MDREMSRSDTVFVVGCGAVGGPLAACLAAAGRNAVAVRTSDADQPARAARCLVRLGGRVVDTEVATIGLSRLEAFDGVVALATKAHLNARLARELAPRMAGAPLVILQNGLGVEEPFGADFFPEVHRAVLYVTGEGSLAQGFRFEAVDASPVGCVRGTAASLRRCIAAISTPDFPFRTGDDIRGEAWRKTIINCVFNTICPLLDCDNGVFAKQPEARDLARELIDEAAALASRLGLGVDPEELMERVLLISGRSDRLISTLQDIRNGRETEMRHLNLELARLARRADPPVPVPRLELLGRLVELKSRLGRPPGPQV